MYDTVTQYNWDEKDGRDYNYALIFDMFDYLIGREVELIYLFMPIIYFAPLIQDIAMFILLNIYLIDVLFFWWN